MKTLNLTWLVISFAAWFLYGTIQGLLTLTLFPISGSSIAFWALAIANLVLACTVSRKISDFCFDKFAKLFFRDNLG